MSRNTSPVKPISRSVGLVCSGFLLAASTASAQETPPPPLNADTTVLSEFKPVFAGGELKGCEYDFIVAHPNGSDLELLSGYILLMKPLADHPETRLFGMSMKISGWPRAGQPRRAWTQPADLGLQDGRRTNSEDIQSSTKSDDSSSLIVAFRPGEQTRSILAEALISGRLGAFYSSEPNGLSTTFSIRLDSANYNGPPQQRDPAKLVAFQRCSLDIGYLVLN